jgi:hypothetical protein
MEVSLEGVRVLGGTGGARSRLEHGQDVCPCKVLLKPTLTITKRTCIGYGGLEEARGSMDWKSEVDRVSHVCLAWRRNTPVN